MRRLSGIKTVDIHKRQVAARSAVAGGDAAKVPYRATNGHGHGHGEQGLLLARLVPADLPRVHVGGLRQVGPGHPKLRPAQADSFTQLHDPFHTSREPDRPRDQTGRKAASEHPNGLW